MAGDAVKLRKRVIGKFQQRIHRAVSMNRVFEKNSTTDSNDSNDKDDKDDNSIINDRDTRRN